MYWLFLIYALDDGSRIERPFWAWDSERACVMEGDARVNNVTIVDYVCRFLPKEGDTIDI